MKPLPRQALTAVGLALLAACAGTGSGVPNTGGASQPATGGGDKAARVQLSGQYAGTIDDNKNGSGKFNLSLSQYASALGGTLTTSPSNVLIANVSWVVAKTSIAGTSVTVTGSTYCTFDHTASYDTKRSLLIGSYKAVYGCSGEAGTYRFKHECYYKGTTGADVRPENGPRGC